VKVPGSPRHANQSYGCGENGVAAGYFHTLGTALVAGREFAAGDVQNSSKVAILNQTFARLLFEKENPIGRHILLKKTDVEIVGVVKDSKFDDVREKPQPFVYVPHEQAGDDMTLQAAYFLRTGLDERAVMPAVKAIVKQTDADLPIERITTMRVMIDESIYQDRLIAILAIAFGVLAAILAAIGLYGTMSYSAACRTHEFGIRLALGANPRTVLALVIREAAWLIIVGVAAGLSLSIVLARVVQSQFYGVTAHDSWTLIGAALLIAAVGACAALAPALRSMRISPIRALRYE
jgi:predicted permease